MIGQTRDDLLVHEIPDIGPHLLRRLGYKIKFLTLPRLDSPSSLLDHLEEKRKTGMSLDYFVEASPPVVNKPSSR